LILALQVLSTTVFVFLALFIGFWVSYEDIRMGKIRNGWILWGFAIGFALNVFFLVVSFFAGGDYTQELSYFSKVMLNGLVAIIFSFVLWKLSVWSAGDAKLFMMYAFLLPPVYYSSGYMEVFPAFALFINVFAVSIVCVTVSLVRSIFTPGTGSRRAGEKKIEPAGKSGAPLSGIVDNLHVFIVVFVIFGAAMYGLNRVRDYFSGSGYYLMVNLGIFMFMFIFMRPLVLNVKKWFDSRPALKPWIISLIPVLFIVIFLTGTGKEIVGMLKTLVVFMVVIGGLRKIMDLYISKVDVNRIRLRDLEPGMVMTDESAAKFGPGDSGTLFMDGLTFEQVESLKNNNDVTEEVEVFKTIPFAPMAFAGLVLTIIIRQSVIHMLLSGFYSS